MPDLPSPLQQKWRRCLCLSLSTVDYRQILSRSLSTPSGHSTVFNRYVPLWSALLVLVALTLKGLLFLFISRYLARGMVEIDDYITVRSNNSLYNIPRLMILVSPYCLPLAFYRHTHSLWSWGCPLGACAGIYDEPGRQFFYIHAHSLTSSSSCHLFGNSSFPRLKNRKCIKLQNISIERSKILCTLHSLSTPAFLVMVSFAAIHQQKACRRTHSPPSVPWRSLSILEYPPPDRRQDSRPGGRWRWRRYYRWTRSGYWSPQRGCYKSHTRSY